MPNSSGTSTEDSADPESASASDSKSSSWPARLLREPLLHFLILGAALFAIHGYVSSDTETPAGDAIVVSGGKIEHLAALFTRTWQRPPSRTELEGLVNDFIREEAAYREGTEIGLDRNDTIIRRRIRQKLEFLTKDIADQQEPSDEELQTYLDEHADKFRRAFLIRVGQTRRLSQR